MTYTVANPTKTRPAWIADDDLIYLDNFGASGAVPIVDDAPPFSFGYRRSSTADKIVWQTITTFSITDDHWAVAPLRAGFTPWFGWTDTTPTDWDSGPVMLRNGAQTTVAVPSHWRTNGNVFDIIGYNKRVQYMQQSGRVSRIDPDTIRECVAILTRDHPEAAALLSATLNPSPREQLAIDLHRIVYPDRGPLAGAQPQSQRAFLRLADYITLTYGA